MKIMENNKRLNRIREALALRGMKKIDLAEKTGISKATISHWVNQKFQPKQTNLMKLAKALNVSEMWLAGFDFPMERIDKKEIILSDEEKRKANDIKIIVNQIKENEELKTLFLSICSLSDDQRKTIESIVNELNKVNSLH